MSSISPSHPYASRVAVYAPAIYRNNENMKIHSICSESNQIFIKNDENQDFWEIPKNVDLSNWMLSDTIVIGVNAGFYSLYYPYTLTNKKTKEVVIANLSNP